MDNSRFCFGTGKKILADFEKGPFPFFSAINFKGNKSNFFHFKNYQTGSLDTKKTTERDEVENSDSELNLVNLDLKINLSRSQKKDFLGNFEKVKTATLDGDIWVMNLAEKFEVCSQNSEKKEDARLILLKTFYEFLKLNKSFCGGVWIEDDLLFCSLSPEILLFQESEIIQTLPIKGTGTKDYLTHSEKEKSELAMVTDLLRNDFGQICQKVELKNERFLREESGFFHARSQIQGILKNNNLSLEDLLQLFPAGSISGAPKKRVCEYIDELENFDREYFTGSFGVRFSPEDSVFNILIRTLFYDLKTKTYQYPVGVGLTYESKVDEEWEECLAKTQILRTISGKNKNTL